ncbi:MAG: hypothetical protein ILNGONEN_02466 [Syntrophorhabdaceae bacterium]|jgi:hypothetical protein|nr:hypothetical protein [Syntrophorhabdaceae bacterium]HOR57572.1 hypothetical protein [bacterium]
MATIYGQTRKTQKGFKKMAKYAAFLKNTKKIQQSGLFKNVQTKKSTKYNGSKQHIAFGGHIKPLAGQQICNTGQIYGMSLERSINTRRHSMIYTDGELLVSDTSLNELHLFANVIGLKKNGSVTNLSTVP